MKTDLMRVHWLVPGQFNAVEELLQCPLASIRLRAGALASAGQQSLRLTAGDTVPDDAQICVIGKIGTHLLERRQSYWRDQLERHTPLKVVLDYTDNHLGYESPMSGFYRWSTTRADAAVCASEILAHSLSNHFAGPIHVIADAADLPMLKPRHGLHSPRSLLWFGHATNVPALTEWLRELEWEQPLRLIALTNEVGVEMIRTTRIRTSAQIQLLLDLWSPQRMVQVAEKADLCVLPVEWNSPEKKGASANRLLTALALGLPSAADPLDAYLPHRAYWAALRSPEFRTLLDNPIAWHDQVSRAQSELIPQFSPKYLGAQWQLWLQSQLA